MTYSGVVQKKPCTRTRLHGRMFSKDGESNAQEHERRSCEPVPKYPHGDETPSPYSLIGLFYYLWPDFTWCIVPENPFGFMVFSIR